MCHCSEGVSQLKSQTARISTGLLHKIFYTWGRYALLKMWEHSLCVDHKHFPWTILVFFLLQCIDLCGWWECWGSIRACVHPPAFIIDDSELSKWLRKKVEMEAEAGVVILEQGNLTAESVCFSICPSLSPCGWSDGQALKPAGGPARMTSPCRGR